MKHPFILEAYTRAQAIKQGLLVDVSDIAATVGFSIPVALTWAAWSACIEWTPGGQVRKDAAELADRVRGLLQQCATITKQSAESRELQDRLDAEGLPLRVRCGNHHHPIQLTLTASFPLESGDDLGVTIMLPDEF